MLFPTAETLPTVIERADALDEGAIVVLVNPQYTTSGQVVSDFGWGSSKRAAEAFLDGMTPAFMTTERRISGVDARVVRAFPDDFFVYADGELVGSSQAPPSIAAIKAMIADASKDSCPIDGKIDVVAVSEVGEDGGDAGGDKENVPPPSENAKEHAEAL